MFNGLELVLMRFYLPSVSYFCFYCALVPLGLAIRKWLYLQLFLCNVFVNGSYFSCDFGSI